MGDSPLNKLEKVPQVQSPEGLRRDEIVLISQQSGHILMSLPLEHHADLRFFLAASHCWNTEPKERHIFNQIAFPQPFRFRHSTVQPLKAKFSPQTQENGAYAPASKSIAAPTAKNVLMLGSLSLCSTNPLLLLGCAHTNHQHVSGWSADTFL